MNVQLLSDRFGLIDSLEFRGVLLYSQFHGLGLLVLLVSDFPGGLQ